MLDALTGYNEAETDRVKILASLIRTAVTKLWNTQIVESDRLTETELWPFPWDKNTGFAQAMSDEERKKIEDAQAEILIKKFPDGNSDIKS